MDFRDQLIAAPLKRFRPEKGKRTGRYFRDQLIAAPLKLNPAIPLLAALLISAIN